MSQAPAATMPVQLSMPSLTVTLPPGVPAPGATGATAYCTVTACPTSEGSGASDVIVVVVSAGLTWCDALADAGLGLSKASPAYVALSDLAPAVDNASAHWPSATVPVHDWVPSLTVTLPVGVPPAGALTATLYCTVTACPATDGSGVSELIVVVVFALIAGDVSAPFRFSRRPETVLPLSPARGSPVFSSAVFTAATVAEGLAENSTAAAPATCGEAIDVPSSNL